MTWCWDLLEYNNGWKWNPTLHILWLLHPVPIKSNQYKMTTHLGHKLSNFYDLCLLWRLRSLQIGYSLSLLSMHVEWFIYLSPISFTFSLCPVWEIECKVVAAPNQADIYLVGKLNDFPYWVYVLRYCNNNLGVKYSSSLSSQLSPEITWGLQSL